MASTSGGGGPSAAEEEAQVAEELLLAMEDYSPTIPDEVTNHFLAQSGFQCSDPRVTRLVSLAAHKFIADITDDALERCKQRQQPKAAAAAAQGGKSGKSEMRLVLTTEDLSASCKEYGIHIKRPPYFADKPSK